MKKIIFIPILLFACACKDKETPKPNNPEQPISERIQGDWKIIKTQSEKHLTTFPYPDCQKTDKVVLCMSYLNITGSEITRSSTITGYDFDNDTMYSYDDVHTTVYTLNEDTIVADKIFKEGTTINFSGDTLIFKIPNTTHIGEDNIIRYVDSYSYYVKK